MTTAPTLETFYSIVKQAVVDMDYLLGVQVNTFGLVDESPDLLGHSFGYSFGDFENGFFWSRRWVLSGADPNTINAEFPAIFVELEDTDLKTGAHRISFVLVDKIECENCPAGVVRTGPMLTANLTRAARALLKEIDTYALYEKGDEYAWASQGRAATWTPLPTDEVDYLHHYLNTDSSSIRPWGDYSGLRGITLSMTLTTCESETALWKYNEPVEPMSGATNCGC